MAYVTVQLIYSDNDHGIAVAGKETQAIADAYYFNVYEPEENRALSQRLAGAWTNELAESIYIDSYSRIVIETEPLGEVYRYHCQPVEGYDGLLTLITRPGPEEEVEAQTQEFYFSLSEDAAKMQWIDPETLEIVSEWSLAEEIW